MRSLRICLIASSRFPVAEPFVGGLEAFTYTLARSLTMRGHEVALFAARGSDPRLKLELLDVDVFEPTPLARSDVSAPPEQWMQEHHAYLRLMLGLAASGRERFDVVHNNSLHHLPVAMSPAMDLPLLTTLHTPPTPWLESAMRIGSRRARFVAVSEFTARQWSGYTDARVIPNGVDTAVWKPGPGGRSAVWFGRLVPEKGPHLAIDAARRAGIPIDLAGPVLDRAYFDAEIAPRLGPDVQHVGHLDSASLAELVGGSAVAVATPRWDEPYGLVAAEAMACGTPVAAFDRGGIAESITTVSGRLAPGDDVNALARAIRDAAALSRADTIAHAVRHCSLDSMVRAYEAEYSASLELAA